MKNYQKQKIPELIRDAGLMPRLVVTQFMIIQNQTVCTDSSKLTHNTIQHTSKEIWAGLYGPVLWGCKYEC